MNFAPFAHPLALTASSFFVAVAATNWVDRFALPAKVRSADRADRRGAGVVADIFARIFVVAAIYAIFFAISWRPLYALAGTLSTFAIFTGISRAKFEFIREPLVFSDIALVTLVFRHKEMFYASWLNIAFWVGALGYIFGASALFMMFEPTLLPADRRLLWIAVGVAVAAAPWLAPFDRRLRETFSRWAAALTGKDNIKRLTVRLGTLAAVTYGFLAWLGGAPKPAARTLGADVKDAPRTLSASVGEARPLLVVWQSESFMDMRHFGVASIALPNLDRLRLRAAAWGRLSSIFEGGYTMRTEFSVISGLRPDELGPDAAHPYLRAAPYAEVAWPTLFRKAGWSTHFVHPYDRQFFSRDRALPLLGFEVLTMLDAFEHDRLHDGPYVSDLTLSKRVLQLCSEERGEGQFMFAASMENHGPWRLGRHGDSADPLSIYLAILQRADAALGYLADELDRLDRPVWLAFYGDHAPILKSFADPFPDPRTDYIIVPMARAATRFEPAQASEKAPSELIAAMVGHAGLGMLTRPDEAA